MRSRVIKENTLGIKAGQSLNLSIYIIIGALVNPFLIFTTNAVSFLIFLCIIVVKFAINRACYGVVDKPIALSTSACGFNLLFVEWDLKPWHCPHMT